jgi:hypothetical protein
MLFEQDLLRCGASADNDRQNQVYHLDAVGLLEKARRNLT